LQKLTNKEQLISHLRKTRKRDKISYPKACAIADEILQNQQFIKVPKKGPETVGEYYLKYLAKNGKRNKKTRKNKVLPQ
jgi:hypothetical protein